MKNVMKYNGYSARVEFDPEDRIFFGRIAGIKDIISFHGDSVDELIAAFEESVDDYIATCDKLGQRPNKPYSGNVSLRVSPELHAAVAVAADISGKSINQWAADVLEKAVR